MYSIMNEVKTETATDFIMGKIIFLPLRNKKLIVIF